MLTSTSTTKRSSTKKSARSSSKLKLTPPRLKRKQPISRSNTVNITKQQSLPNLNSNLKSIPSTSPSKSELVQNIDTHPSLTDYRKRLYRALLSIPTGRWTTYTALSDYLNSGPRAVGNANRTNPFAPDVPCHRVLAADRTIGKFKGDWPLGGTYQVEKRKLLDGEGVIFDDKGRAKGECFRDFDKIPSSTLA